MTQAQSRRGVGLTLIAVGKLIQLLLVSSVGTAALLFSKRSPPALLEEWADAFEPQSAWVQHILDELVSLSSDKLAFVGRTSIAYASLFLVEGIGLWRNQRWAEYLTAIVTASFIPFELHGLFQEFNVAKLVALIVNGAVVVYLTVRLIRDHERNKA